MPPVIGGISIYVEDDTARFQRSMADNARLVEQQSQRMTRALQGTARSVDELNRRASHFQPDAFRALAISALRAQNSVERLRTSMLAIVALSGGGFAGAFAAKTLADTADRYTNIQNRIAAVVRDSRERVNIERQLFDIAQRSRASFEATAQLYQRMTLSASNLGASQREILQVVETTQKALLTAGSTTQEAASAATQLSQALGAGRLQGDELRSILENAPLLAQAIAREFNVSVGELKEMGANGELVANRVFKAILSSAEDIDERFRQIRPTVSQALVVLDNAFTRYIGGVDQSLGASAALATGIMALANNLQTLGTIASYVAPILAGVFANRMLQRAGGAATAPFRADMASRQQALAQSRAAEQMAAERVVNAGANLAQVRSRARTDLESFADPIALRDRTRLQKEHEALDEAFKKSREKFAANEQRLSGVQVQTGRAYESAINRETKARDALAGKLAREKELKDLIRQADVAATAAAGASALRGTDAGSARAAKEVEKLRGEYQKLVADEIPKAQRALATSATQVAGMYSAADAAAKTTRRTIMQQQAEVLAETQDVVRRRGLTADVRGVNEQVIQQTAQQSANRAIATAFQQTQIAAAGYAQAQVQVARSAQQAGAATSMLATGLGLARAGFGGLLAFLGGPLGAAVTAAVVGWGLYEVAQARASARAKEFADASEAAVEQLKQLKEAQSAGGPIGGLLAAVNPTLNTLREGLAPAVAEVQREFAGLAFMMKGSAQFEGIAALSREMSKATKDGTVTVDMLERVRRAAENLSGLDPNLEPLIQGLLRAAGAAATTLARFQQLRTQATLAQALRGDFDDARDSADRQRRDTSIEAQQNKFFRDELQKLDERTESIDEINRKGAARIRQDKQLSDQLADAQISNTKDRLLKVKRETDKLKEEFPDADPKLIQKVAETRAAGLKSQGAKDGERIAERLERIMEAAKAGFFTDVDRELIEQLAQIKGAGDLAKRTREALEQGTAIPEQAQQLRNALVAREAAKEYRQIVEAYGSMNQVMPMVTAHQEKLNALLAMGKIDAGQYNLALADFMGRFQQFQWIDRLADSFMNFGNSISDALWEGKLGADTFSQALDNLGKAIFQLAIQETMLTPLRNAIRGGIAGFMGGGGGGAGIPTMAQGGVGPDIPASFLHQGGVSGLDGVRRPVDPRVFIGAPRYHSGLRHNEVAAILERGEKVLTDRQGRGLGAMAGALSNMPGPVQNNFQIVTPPGSTVSEERTTNPSGGVDYRAIIQNAAAEGVADRGSPLNRNLRKVFGVTPGITRR